MLCLACQSLAQKNTDELSAAITLAYQRVQKAGILAGTNIAIFFESAYFLILLLVASYEQLYLDTSSHTLDGWPSIQLSSQDPTALTPPVPSPGSTLDDALKRGTIRVVDNPADNIPW